MSDVVAQVVDEVGVWIVGYNDLGSSTQRTDEARQAPASA
jgi:hypothetical protein